MIDEEHQDRARFRRRFGRNRRPWFGGGDQHQARCLGREGSAPGTAACPTCHRQAGGGVRAGVHGRHFGPRPEQSRVSRAGQGDRTPRRCRPERPRRPAAHATGSEGSRARAERQDERGRGGARCGRTGRRTRRATASSLPPVGRRGRNTNRPGPPSTARTRSWRRPKRRPTSRGTKPGTRSCAPMPTGPLSRPWPNPGRSSPPVRLS